MKMPVRVFPARKLPGDAHSDGMIFVMTDLHGSIGAMRRLLSHKPKDARLVFLGDATDRGPSSVEVLETLDSFPDAILLRGNHDLMAWYAIHGDPTLRVDELDELRELWVEYNGGMATIEDFLCHEEDDEMGMSVAEYLAGGLSNPVFEKIFSKSQKCWKSGNLFFVHGGLAVGQEDEWLKKPDVDAVSMTFAAKNHWAWYRPRDHRDGLYENRQRYVHGEPVYVVCGHTPQPHDGLIHEYGMFLDTGYMLKTAAIIYGSDVKLIMTPCDEVREIPDEIWGIFNDCKDAS